MDGTTPIGADQQNNEGRRHVEEKFEGGTAKVGKGPRMFLEDDLRQWTR